MSNDDFDAPVLTPTLFGIIVRNRLGGGVPDGLDPVGLQSTADKDSAGLLSSCPGELAVILEGFANTVPERLAVGMTGNFYGLVTEFLQDSPDPPK